MSDLVGKTLGRYDIVAGLGRGGMAEVYKAYQPSLSRHVAVKVLHGHLAEDEGFVGRFTIDPAPPVCDGAASVERPTQLREGSNK